MMCVFTADLMHLTCLKDFLALLLVSWAPYSHAIALPAIDMLPLLMACMKLSLPLSQEKKSRKLWGRMSLATITNQRKQKVGKSQDAVFPALGAVEGQSLGLQARSSSHEVMFSYIALLAALRGTGQPLGGLTVDMGMFSESFPFWKVWKASLSSNIRHLRLSFFFFF